MTQIYFYIIKKLDLWGPMAHLFYKGSKKKLFDGFNPQWGGGGFGPNPLFTYFFYF